MPIKTEVADKVWYRYEYARDNGHSDFVIKANLCERMFVGDQWSRADLITLRQARRPALTINKIISTIGNVLGEQIYNRSEISFRPKAGAKSETADVLTKVFKSISDSNQLDWLRSDMFTDGVITSRGFIDIRMCFDDSMKGQVKYCVLNPKNVVIDPDADEHDPDTWNEVITTKWMTADDVAIMYSKADSEILRNKDDSYYPYGFDSIDTVRDRFGESYNGGVQYNGLGANSDFDMSPVMRSLRVIERQHKMLDRQDHFVNMETGDMRPIPKEWSQERIDLVVNKFGYQVIPKLVKRIRWTVICDNVVLHDDWSPYKHFTVVPYFPYFRRGTTIGLVENLVGPQELLNKTSSQELHIVNTTANSGWKVKTGALSTMSIQELEARGAETGLVIEYNNSPDDIEKITPNSTPTGLDRISYKAEEHIKTISGVSDSQQGMDREDVAAKAIQAKRQAASTNLAKPLDSLVRTDFMIARNTLDLIQTFYTEPQILTLTNKLDGSTSELAINQVSPEGEVINDLMLGEYEVTISSVPQRETLEDSQFDQAVAMKEMGIAIPDEFIVKASRMLDKTELIAAMKEAANSPAAQQAAQVAAQQQQADLAKTQAETQQKTADASLKGAKAQGAGVDAQKEAMTPPEGQGDDGAGQAAIMKAQADIELAKEKFQAEMALKQQEFQLKERELEQKLSLAQQTAAQDMQLKVKAQQDTANAARIAAVQRPQPTVNQGA